MWGRRASWQGTKWMRKDRSQLQKTSNSRDQQTKGAVGADQGGGGSTGKIQMR